MKWFWVSLFVAWPVAAVGLLAASPWLGWWFPESSAGDLESVNPLGRSIDHLFYVILAICGVVFVLTQAALAWALLGGANRERARVLSREPRPRSRVDARAGGRPVLHRVLSDGRVGAVPRRELLPRRRHPVAEVTGRMYEWRVRYPAPGEPLTDSPRPGDLYAVNELLIPAGRPALIRLRTEDVQHSFSLPQFRVKQDALPGQLIPVWFQADRPGNTRCSVRNCAGGGHYKMGGVVKAVPAGRYAAAMAALAAEQNSDGPIP